MTDNIEKKFVKAYDRLRPKTKSHSNKTVVGVLVIKLIRFVKKTNYYYHARVSGKIIKPTFEMD